MKIQSIEVNTEEKANRISQLLGCRFWMTQRVYYNDNPISKYIVYYFTK